MPISLTVIEPGIAVLRVNRPQVHNALNWQAMEKFAECIEQAHRMDDLCALIITGTGHSFIAGGDLKELHHHPTEADGLHLSQVMTDALNRLETLPCPTIAAINGPARGGGVEIALACDLRVMAADANLGLVQARLGLTPGWGAGQRLLRLVGYSRALEWLASGAILNAQQALEERLVNRVTLPGEALASAIEMAQEIGRNPRAAVYAIKRLLRGGLTLPPEQAAQLEQSEFAPLWAADEHIQAVSRFLARKPRKADK